MLNLIPQSTPEQRPQAYAEAVCRLASVRQALRLVDPFGGGPASDLNDDSTISRAWENAPEAKRRWFDNRSARLVGATAAGVEVLLEERQTGRVPHEQASQTLVDQIRRELAQVSRLILA